MLLSARILTSVANVNVFEYADVAEFTEGDGPAIYFQIVDASLDRNHRPSGRRYMPAAGATLEVVIHSIDDDKKVTRYASQPFSTDPSIWKLQLQSSDQVRGTCSMKLTLVEGSTTTRGHVDSVISAHAQNRGW